jgi:hypothetical protein
LSNGGTCSAATTSAARTRPSAAVEADVDRARAGAAADHERLGIFEWRHPRTVPAAAPTARRLDLGRDVFRAPRAGRLDGDRQFDHYRAFPADGFEARWTTWDGEHTEHLTLRWENEAWTASGRSEREQVEYVIRLSPLWHVRQFLLFRDLPDPTSGWAPTARVAGAR